MIRPPDIDASWHPLVHGCPPDFASEWGEDEHGVYVAFTLDSVTQRLRWIPAGSFTMGSPEDEPGRRENEGPPHPVYISRGFWFFDTPCTQSLWQAVMGDNPSRFQSPDRPVEGVSWDGVARFLERINRRVPGLELVLPSEAQWEYACRAGTDTALYTGPIEILGAKNAPVLDAIAWYGGNSGVDYELDEVHNSSNWLETQYPHTKAGTHPVASREPNRWGLYDMLGNVWEWCADGRRVYDSDAKLDPRGVDHADAYRVIRGGSWSADARFCRAAYRGHWRPGDRDGPLGFRPARVQVP